MSVAESQRIAFYLQRDGEASAKETVARNFAIYYRCLMDLKHYYSNRDMRSGIVDDLLEMLRFVGGPLVKASLVALKVAHEDEHLSPEGLEALRIHPKDLEEKEEVANG